MAVEAPPMPQRRRGPSRLTQAVEATGAAALVVAGIGGAAVVGDKLITGNFPWENSNQGGIVSPDKTPKPSATVTMPSATPGQTLEVTIPPVVTPSPSQETSPSPVPSASPEATPVPSIESVKLVSEGSAAMEIAGPPKGIFNIYDATVVALEKNPDGTVKDFAVTVGSGNKISRIGSNIFKDLYSYKGVTFWINVKNLTALADINYEPAFKKLGEGPIDISRYIEVGKSVPEISMYFDSPPGYPGYAELNAPNLNTYNKLNNSIGKTFPRSYRGFTFNAGGVSVQP